METRGIWRQLVGRCLGAAVVIALLVAGAVKAAHLAPATEALVAVLAVMVLLLGWWRVLLWRGLAPFDGPAPTTREPWPAARRIAESGGDD